MSIHQTLDRFFSKREIRDCDGSIYMHRWFVLRTSFIALFIHKFVRSDLERAVHDHPWNFIVIPLWRGYIEHSEVPNDFFTEEEQLRFGSAAMQTNKRRVYPLLGIRFRRAEYRHRVELFTKSRYYVDWSNGFPESKRAEEMLPSWSIFIRFRKRRKWGFWFPTGWTEAMEWWQKHCEDTPEMEIGSKPGEVISKH